MIGEIVEEREILLSRKIGILKERIWLKIGGREDIEWLILGLIEIEMILGKKLMGLIKKCEGLLKLIIDKVREIIESE